MAVPIPKALFLCLTCHLLLFKAYSKCQPSFPCRNFTLQFPFTDYKEPGCGLVPVYGCDSQYEFPSFRIRGEQSPSPEYSILGKIPGKNNSLLVLDFFSQALLKNGSCLALSDISLTNSPSVSFTFSPNLTLFQCPKKLYNDVIAEHFKEYGKKECVFTYVYYNKSSGNRTVDSGIPYGCYVVHMPMSGKDSDDLFEILTAKFVLEWSVSEACSKCYNGGGQCLTDNKNKFYCDKDDGRLKLILALSISGAGVLLLLSITYTIWLSKKKSGRGYIRSRNISSSKSDIEGGIFCFGIPVFSYEELEEATNNFDPSKVLGDGAFGTVYRVWLT